MYAHLLPFWLKVSELSLAVAEAHVKDFGWSSEYLTASATSDLLIPWR